MDKKRQRLAILGGAVVLIIIVTIILRMSGSQPPPATGNGYYEGPWVNKKGDLVDTRTGKILQKNYEKPPANQMKAD